MLRIYRFVYSYRFVFVDIINYRSMNKPVYILGIESSCDETAAAVFQDDRMLSNIIASQDIHRLYGGVVPELASRAHQQKIIPVVDAALKQANVSKNDLSAVAFTRGPGLMGALLVGVSFAKAMSLALDIPLIEVNHMQGHVLAHFIRPPAPQRGDAIIEKHFPKLPFLCLTVSGGHTQIVRVDSLIPPSGGGGAMTCFISIPKCFAKAWSRESCAGTAITAPVP